MRDLGQQKLNPSGGDVSAQLMPISEAGSGQIQEHHKMRLDEIVASINDLFHGEVTDGDNVSYVDNVLKGKILKSDILCAQAAVNTKEQFSNSPSLPDALTKAIMDATEAHQTMSTQALSSDDLESDSELMRNELGA